MADNNDLRSESSSTFGSGCSMVTASQRDVSRSSMFLRSLSDCEILNESSVISELQHIEPTAAILDYCKRRFRRPFEWILGFTGLLPMKVDTDWISILGYVQTCIVLFFLCLGYVLQFIGGFRRDRGFVTHVPSGPMIETRYDLQRYFRFKNLIDSGEITFIFVIPAILHAIGFLTAVFVYRIGDNEHLQCLTERVFMLSNEPRLLVKKFWCFNFIGMLWLLCSIGYVVSLGVTQTEVVKNSYINITENEGGPIRTVLYIGLFCQDFVQVVVVCSYSIECLLLRHYLTYLKDKLVRREIEPLEWMRAICEFQKFLHQLNTKWCIPVCFLTLLNISYTFASIVNLLKDIDSCPVKIFSLTLANILLWMLIAVAPFVHAAALTVTCRATQRCGHLISVRPFVHRDSSTEELNTILLYASSLKMNAKLFRMPINVHYLCFLMLSCLIIILTFGMCLNISIGLY